MSLLKYFQFHIQLYVSRQGKCLGTCLISSFIPTMIVFFKWLSMINLGHIGYAALKNAMQFNKHAFEKTSMLKTFNPKLLRLVQTLWIIQQAIDTSYVPLLSSPFHKCRLSPPQTQWRPSRFWQWPRHSWQRSLEGLWGSRSVECLWRVEELQPLWPVEGWAAVGLARRVQVQEMEAAIQVFSLAESIETVRHN